MAPPLPAPDALARELLSLARTDRDAARARLSELPLEDQVALLGEAPPHRRALLLELVRDPAPLVRALPEAELVFTARALGLADAGWLLEHATEDQMRAATDLDAWRGFELDPEALDAWMGGFAGGGDEALLRAARALDPELLVRWLQDRAQIVLREPGDEWEPPAGARTIDGQFHLVARRERDDLAVALRMLTLLFERDQPLYARLLRAATVELPTELEETALRVRAGRLEDLGFPPWEEAMRMYGFLRPEQRARLPEGARGLATEPWRLPVWEPRLPATPDARHSIFRAAAELEPEERRAFLYGFLSLANRVAVAERLPLGDPDSVATALDRAAALASRGLDLLAERHELPPAEVLRRVPLEHLFRVGHSLAREEGRGLDPARGDT